MNDSPAVPPPLTKEERAFDFLRICARIIIRLPLIVAAFFVSDILFLWLPTQAGLDKVVDGPHWYGVPLFSLLVVMFLLFPVLIVLFVPPIRRFTDALESAIAAWIVLRLRRLFS